MTVHPTTLLSRIHRVLKRTIYYGPFNLALRSSLKPLRALLPIRLLYRIPLVGTLEVHLPEFPPLKLFVNGLDDVSGPLYWRGVSGVEGPTLGVFAHLLREAEVVLDVGAYIGVYALLAGLDSSSRTVYAFEPMPEIAATLRRNVEVNGAHNVSVEEVAIADNNGEATLFIPRAGLPSSSSTREGFREAQRRVRVSTMTLDSFVKSRNLPRVDLIKVDTETTEPEVLIGARSVLEHHQPMIICEVLAGQREDDLNDILSEFEYRYFRIAREGLIEKQRIEGDPSDRDNNFLFVPTAKIASIDSLILRSV